MAEYNTRGSGAPHKKDYDVVFNKNYSWDTVFQEIVEARVSEIPETGFFVLSHTTGRILHNEKGNRDLSEDELSLNIFQKNEFEVVETEWDKAMCGNQEMLGLKKALVRLPERPDGEQVCAVINFEDSGNAVIKTAYLNKANDNHETGLKTNGLSTVTDTIYGFFGNAKGMSQAWVRNSDGVYNKVNQPARESEDYLLQVTQKIIDNMKELDKLEKRGKQDSTKYQTVKQMIEDYKNGQTIAQGHVAAHHKRLENAMKSYAMTGKEKKGKTFVREPERAMPQKEVVLNRS